MGDIRFDEFRERLEKAPDRALAIRSLADDEVVAALASASRTKDPLLANVLATEAQNRLAQRQRLEMSLLEAEERYRLLAEHSSDAVLCTDADDRITYASPAIERLLGYDADALVGKPVTDLAAPEERDHLAAERDAARSEGKETTLTFEARRASGERVWLEETTRSFDLSTGMHLGTVEVVRDVTRRRDQEGRQSWCSAFVRSAPDAIVGADLAGRILTCNRVAGRLYGWSESAVQGHMLEELVPEHRRAHLREAVARAENVKEGVPLDLDVLCLDGSLIPARLTVLAVRAGADERRVGTALIARAVDGPM